MSDARGAGPLIRSVRPDHIVKPKSAHLTADFTDGVDGALSVASVLSAVLPSLDRGLTRRDTGVCPSVRVCSGADADGAMMPEQVASVNCPGSPSLDAFVDFESPSYTRPVPEL